MLSCMHVLDVYVDVMYACCHVIQSPFENGFIIEIDIRSDERMWKLISSKTTVCMWEYVMSSF